MIALAGVAVAVAALAIVVRATAIDIAPAGRLMAACRGWLGVAVEPASILIIGFAALATTVFARALVSGVRSIRSTRAYMRTLTPHGTLPGPVRTHVIDDPTLLAFCAGLLRPRVYVSTGAIHGLDEAELDAVLAHEAHHAARRDPLRLFVAQVLAEALFFLPVMKHLHRRYSSLAELAADDAAVRLGGGSQPLASALLAFGQADGSPVVGVSAERVDHLLGRHPRAGLPASLVVGAAVTMSALAGLLLATAHLTQMGQINLSVLLMQSCGPLMIGAPALALAVGFRRHRSR